MTEMPDWIFPTSDKIRIPDAGKEMTSDRREMASYN
jgi:hypothetical protein